jgi:hypothetical protein
MPVHDWTRVEDGIFHDFHVAWIGELRRVLNGGLLPPDCYALAEQIVGDIGPDVIALHAPQLKRNGSGAAGEKASLTGGVAVATAPPKVQMTLSTQDEGYTRRRRTLVIRHTSDHRIIALIEIVSAGHKASRHAFASFLRKALAALEQGIHLLLIDLHPPTPRDAGGLHVALWDELTGKICDLPGGKNLTLAAYAAGPPTTAYVQPIAVGEALPDMPLFLTTEQYINVPLERTYLGAYEGVPRFYRDILEQS